MLPLTLTDVTVRRKGKRLLGPITHCVDGPGITVILGPNGSGKSTLLRVMHGLERRSTGTVAWDASAATIRAAQSFVFQSPIMLRRSVRENLRYPLRLRSTPPARQDALVVEWATRADLADHLELSANRLSGGERQKLALARALITAPEVLFLDEPCANLDGHATRAIEALLQQTAAAGTKVVLATHDIGQARRLAAEAIFLVDGLIHERGKDIIHAPQTPAFAAFLNGDIVT